MSRWSAPTALTHLLTHKTGPRWAHLPATPPIVDRLCREHGKIYYGTSLSGISSCDVLPPDDAVETDAGLCPFCHDHKAWYEQACAGGPSLLPTGTEAALVPASLPALIATFTFVVGHRVQPIANAPAAVTWCGQHKERHPATGVQRLNVYRLDNGCSDCYREDQLQAACTPASSTLHASDGQ